MPLYALIGTDAAGALERRMEHRPAHLEGLQALQDAGRIRYAGPTLDEAGKPRGSVVVFEAPDLAAATALAAADPYVVEGVFESWQVHETKQGPLV